MTPLGDNGLIILWNGLLLFAIIKTHKMIIKTHSEMLKNHPALVVGSLRFVHCRQFAWFTVGLLPWCSITPPSQNCRSIAFRSDHNGTHCAATSMWPEKQWSVLGEYQGFKNAYRQISNNRRTKSQNVNVSNLVLQLWLLNPFKPGVKSTMKM